MRFNLQAVQDLNAGVFFLAMVFWVMWARKNQSLAGFAWAPLFYAVLVVGFYTADFLFNPEPPEGVGIFTIISALIRLVSGVLLLGAPIIMLIDDRNHGD